jgi:prolyl-tRNA editing enzyme YbaK/EbsC (Cys-tRNA(Pro) deacylase)
MTELPRSAQRVRESAIQLGLDIAVLEMPASTRTAQEAADACGCALGQIVKSLIFQGADTKTPCLLLVSGVNRVNETSMADLIGEVLARPDADYVRELTGFAIGGVPPFGHASTLTTYMDTALLGHARIWAAAGTPKCLFSVNPEALRSATGATVIDVA